VILVSLDTLRADHLELYGYERRTAPHLARLGAEGVVFENVAAQSSWTLSSHKALFAASYPTTILREVAHADLDELRSVDRPSDFMVSSFGRAGRSLVPALSEAGWATAAFVDGGWMAAKWGFTAGFDVYDDAAGGFEAVLTRADRWLREHSEGRRFLFVHTYAIHCPYGCRAPFDTQFCADHAAHGDMNQCGKHGLREVVLASEANRRAVVDHYDGGIASADDYLGLFVRELRARGEYEEALIVVTSDHGESLGEGEQVGHGGMRLEQLWIPLIVKFPASWRVPPTRVREGAALIDVLPTILDACGSDAAEGRDGRSLLPLLFGGAAGRRYLVSQTTFEEETEAVGTNPAKRSVIEPARWQVVEDARAGETLVYSLVDDPDALSALEGGRPDALEALLRELRARDRIAEDEAFERPESRQGDAQIRAIGYGGDG
jgi:arylsulfatase A-like enzyme